MYRSKRDEEVTIEPFGAEAVDRTGDLATIVGPLWSEAKTCEALGGLSLQALESRRGRRSVLGLTVGDGTVAYPVWQFRRYGSDVEVVPDLEAMLCHLRAFDEWAVAVLMCVPALELEGLSPVQWARARFPVAQLAGLARTVAREWSAGCRL
jgi:hypothetical protein